MHQRAVAVTGNVGIQPLVRIAPADAASLAARKHPLREAIEVPVQTCCLLRRDEVNERIAQSRMRPEIDRLVHQVILASEPL